jgi:hypothetical protein
VFGDDAVPGHPVDAGGVADGMKPVDHVAVAHGASLRLRGKRQASGVLSREGERLMQAERAMVSVSSRT